MKLTEFEEKVVAHILQSSVPGKHAARSALRHLERAWKLADEMPELAIFLAITAEEESATALFHALKRRQYEASNVLNMRNHIHKTALHPFLLAAGKLFAEFKDHYSPRFEFNSDLSHGIERLRLRLTIADETGKQWWSYTAPPLEFSVSVNDVVHRFEPELAQLANEKNAASILEYVRRLANRRNQVLYASQQGVPHAIDNIEPFLTYRKSVVFSHLVAVLLVDPYPQKQIFVQQALNAFVAMLQTMSDKSKSNGATSQ
jgi:hypothetical protein